MVGTEIEHIFTTGVNERISKFVVIFSAVIVPACIKGTSIRGAAVSRKETAEWLAGHEEL